MTTKRLFAILVILVALYTSSNPAFAAVIGSEVGGRDPQPTAASALTTVFLPLVLGSGAQLGDNSSGATGSTGSPTARLAWFYKPPSGGDLTPLRQYFDTFVLTKNDEDVRETLKSQGVSGPFLQYLRFEAIMDPGSCTAQPWRNQVADRIGDFCEISEKHPDWFLLDTNGNRIVDNEGGNNFYLMDPGHPGWRAFWLERARQSQEQLGWDGIFLDNVEASLSKRQRKGALPAQYPDDASYQAAINGFLAYIYSSYFQPQGRPLQANIISLKESSVWFSYLQNLDGAMEEGWAVDWSSGYLSTGQWEEHLSRIEQTAAMNKQAVLVSQGSQNDTQRQVFAYVSYLLVAYDNASFRYTNSSSYRQAWIYSNYSVDLGTPLGPRYQDGNVWRRDFSGGFVTVDPVSHTATITTQ